VKSYKGLEISVTDSETLHQMESSGQLHTPSAIALLKEPPVNPQQGI